MYSRGRKKREKVFLNSLSKIALQNSCQINQHEVFGTSAIGIDETKGLVFFYRQVADKDTEQFAVLSEIQTCRVINTNRTYKNKDGNQMIIDRLELSMIPIARNNPELRMEFFRADVNGQLTGELQSIEKWSKLINDRLKQ